MAAPQEMLKLRQALVDIEELGEQFVTVRAKMVDSDRQRNGVREALRSLRKGPANDRVALNIGCGVYARLPPDRAIERLTAEQARLDSEMEAMQKELKRLAARLAEKGATPDDIGPGMLRAMLTLTDRGSTGRQ